ncbi:hypothetical protein SAMN05216249_10468 [Acetitomaculum ruminis DSM 5522]|uniref:Uncharacterized protein n=1 Tax=Acetitomaculum ruminis DSM 5522 TaxID=1120918 RepID=A0A1I0WHG6_9FIRM|nr:hypothetical protein [Acetitomaculum ruminis]SFA87837.1 hypothetical protein SAMN05216249_10468 [Acetitomaculum ruminis DSM 5522]
MGLSIVTLILMVLVALMIIIIARALGFAIYMTKQIFVEIKLLRYDIQKKELEKNSGC